MKKRVKKEPLLNALARKVGHAAGTIAKVTQGLSADAAAIVKTENVETKSAKTEKAQRRAPKLRRTTKKKNKSAKSVSRQSRKRPLPA